MIKGDRAKKIIERLREGQKGGSSASSGLEAKGKQQAYQNKKGVKKQAAEDVNKGELIMDITSLANTTKAKRWK
jgi:hypothetical protein